MDWKDERLTWDEMFMMAAITVASRSSCQHLHSGAVVVKDRRIKSEGYNGAPEGIKNCLELGCRKEKFGVDFNTKETGECIGLHAEDNALSEAGKERTKDATLYTIYYPCNNCARRIANYNIGEVVYLKEYQEPSKLTKEIFLTRGIKIRKLELDIQRCVNILKDTASREIYQ
ncbi:deaminase [Candidatus Pacearchaeota archaeon]|jgi:dCMP deaminase|nr:deaminase [Candidatus Pacearchaeota archaeon]